MGLTRPRLGSCADGGVAAGGCVPALSWCVSRPLSRAWGLGGLIYMDVPYPVAASVPSWTGTGGEGTHTQGTEKRYMSRYSSAKCTVYPPLRLRPSIKNVLFALSAICLHASTSTSTLVRLRLNTQSDTNYKSNQIKGPHKATHGQRRSHIPAPPQGAANPASRSDAGLGGRERVTTALLCETRSFSTPFISVTSREYLMWVLCIYNFSGWFCDA